MAVCDKTVILKANDPLLEIELSSYKFAPAEYDFMFILRKPWPSEDGIYELPQTRFPGLMSLSRVLTLVSIYMDPKDFYARAVYARLNRDGCL